MRKIGLVFCAIIFVVGILIIWSSSKKPDTSLTALIPDTPFSKNGLVYGKVPSLEEIDQCVSEKSKSSPRVYTSTKFVTEGIVASIEGTTVSFKDGDNFDLSQVSDVNLTQFLNGNIDSRQTLTLPYDINLVKDILDTGDNLILQNREGTISTLTLACDAVAT